MAIRLRLVETQEGVGGFAWIALCAARSIEKPGDVYIDDGQHAALMDKCARDYFEMYGVELPGRNTLADLVEREESNNPAREWWDRVYGRVMDHPAV